MRNVTVTWASVAMMLAGCGSGETTNDGGRDAASSPAAAMINAYGANSASWSFDSETNSISCIDTGSGLLSVTAARSARSDERLQVYLRSFDGPGTYELTYGSTTDLSATVSMLGGYEYDFSMNRSNIDLSVVNSSCTLVIAGDGETVPFDISITCSDLVASILSSDYDMRDAAGFRPRVALTARVTCVSE